jgi:hypothetical protein
LRIVISCHFFIQIFLTWCDKNVATWTFTYILKGPNFVRKNAWSLSELWRSLLWPKNSTEKPFCIKYYHCTVGNKVVISPGSDSSKFCFWTFFSIVNTPTKKKPHHKTPCYLPVPRYGSSMWCSWSFLAATWSTLGANISSSVRILFSMYILIRKVFSQLFSDVFTNTSYKQHNYKFYSFF